MHSRTPFGLAIIAATALVGAATLFGDAAPASAAEPPPASRPGQNRITFTSGGEKMAGDLYLPADYKQGQKVPAVVIAGPWLNVKEQVATNYAKRLAAKGFAALAFDFRHWGESGGQPRELESPGDKIDDIRAAVAFLNSRPEIAPGGVGMLGICFGAGYAAEATIREPGIRSLATVAAWLHTRESQDGMFGKAEVARRREAGRAARDAWEKEKRVITVPAASTTDKQAAMFGVDYYSSTSRGVVPEWTNRFAVMSWPEYMDFDGLSRGPKITKPLMVVHSDGCGLPPNARAFYQAAKGPKDLVWLEGNHTDFYDKAPYIDRAADAVTAHFAKTLMAPEDREKRAQAALSGAREFFAALEAGDIPRFLNVWAEDGVQAMPYAPPGFPSRLEGKAAIEKQYGPLPAAYEGMKFPIERIVATDDPNTVLAEYRGSIGLKGGGRYDNRYVGVFSFDSAGKLSRYAEYFDPITLLSGFPGAAEMGPDGPRRVVQSFARLADGRDWAGLRALFADAVDFDYTSVAGGTPGKVKADEIVAGWTQGLGRYKQTKHNFSEPDVKLEGDTASATFTGQATHVRDAAGNDVRWSCGGDYTYRLARTPQGWKVTAMKFDMKWEQGER